MTKRLFTTIIALALATRMTANPVNLSTAKNVASNFMYGQGMKNTEWNEISSPFGFSNIYVLNGTSGDCFVVVSAEDFAHPVLAYSTESRFVMNENTMDWLEGYEQSISQARDANLQADAETAEEWSILLDGERSMDKDNPVGPLLRTKWGQSQSYFNLRCPRSAIVGCVAVAMGQVMKYWSYPLHGTGSHSYYNSFAGDTLRADFASATYMWDSMPLQKPSTVRSNDTATAFLLYHCGVAIETEYSASSSNAYVIRTAGHPYTAENALRMFFGYDSQLIGKLRSRFNDSTWMSMVRTELDNARPVIYNGFNRSYGGGHCFVCDGYKENDYFHFNWGMYGSSDGYFLLSAMTPASGQDFSYNQGGIFGVKPIQTVAIPETPQQIEANVFPNPANDRIFLNIGNGKDIGTYLCEIYDQSGRLLISEKTSSNSHIIDMKSLPQGVYSLRIVGENGETAVKKIIRR